MALVQEDGTGKTNSQTYASEAELSAYAAERGITVSGTDTELLIKALDYLESKDFIGTKGTQEQALQWPRYGAQLDGYYIDSDSIPTPLKEAQMEFALGIDGGVNPLANLPRETKREKVGGIEVEYADSAFATTLIQSGETKVAKLVKQTGTAFRV